MTLRSSVVAKASLVSGREKIVPVSVSVKRVFVAIWLLCLPSVNGEKKKKGVRCFSWLDQSLTLGVAGIPRRNVLIAENSPHFLFFRRAVPFQAREHICLCAEEGGVSALSRYVYAAVHHYPNRLSCPTVNIPQLCILDSPNQGYLRRGVV